MRLIGLDPSRHAEYGDKKDDLIPTKIGNIKVIFKCISIFFILFLYCQWIHYLVTAATHHLLQLYRNRWHIWTQRNKLHLYTFDSRQIIPFSLHLSQVSIYVDLIWLKKWLYMNEYWFFIKMKYPIVFSVKLESKWISKVKKSKVNVHRLLRSIHWQLYC